MGYILAFVCLFGAGIGWVGQESGVAGLVFIGRLQWVHGIGFGGARCMFREFCLSVRELNSIIMKT